MRVTFVGLGLSLACAGCADVHGKHEANINYGRVSDSEGGSSTGLTTGLTLGTTTDVTTTSTTTAGDEGGGDLPAVSEFALTLTASTEKLKRAGSVVLTAKFEGEPSSMELRVIQDGLTLEVPTWPEGESTLEYKVMSEDLNGELTFKLRAENEDGLVADDSVQVQVDLPEHGTLDLRLVAPGNTPTRGTALALVPGTGTEPDEVLIVGTQNETELLIARIDKGALWMSPAPEAEAMHPTGLVADGKGNTFMAGYDGEEMILRKCSRFQVVLWEHRIASARANDLVLGPDNLLYVAGVTRNGDDTDATAWVSTESGSLETFTFEHFSDEEPLESELHGVAFDGGEPVFAGFAAHPEIQDKPERGAVFRISGTTLQLKALQELPKLDEESGWHALSQTEAGLAAVGWHRLPMEESKSLARAQFGAEFDQEQFMVSWPGEGSKIVWHPAGYPVIAGERSVDQEMHLLVHADPWAPFLDQDSGRAFDLVVDRHGYIYFTGESVTNGLPHLIIGRIHP